MVSRRNRTFLSLAIFVGVLAWNVAAAAVKGETGVPVGKLSADEIEKQLKVRLSSYRLPASIVPSITTVKC
jgi:zinc transporter 7